MKSAWRNNLAQRQCTGIRSTGRRQNLLTPTDQESINVFARASLLLPPVTGAHIKNLGGNYVESCPRNP